MRSLLRLMRDCSPEDWFSLAAYDQIIPRRIFGYDVSTKATTPVPSGVPWPLLWLLATFSRKHAFISSKALALTPVVDDLNDFVNRVRWSLWLNGTNQSAPLSSKKRSTRTPHCPHLPPPDVNRYLLALRQRFVAIAVSRTRSLRSSHSNIFGLVRLALRLLKCSEYVIIPNDKHHGFCLVSVSQFHAVLMQSISKQCYRVVALPTLRSTNCIYDQLARRVAEFEENPKLRSTICQSLRGSRVCSLGLLVKTHKAPGDMTMRNLHKVGADGYAYAGLAAWVFQQLDPFVQQMPSLVKDSFAFKAAISALALPSGACLYQLDIKEFFLSGEAPTVATDVAGAFEPPLKPLLLEAIMFLLDNQFVAALPHDTTDPSHLYLRCVLGTGMGLQHSGHVANTAFYERVEKHVLPFCT